MSQLVYLQKMPAETMRYYTTESVQRTAMQPMAFVYSTAAPGMLPSNSTPPQQPLPLPLLQPQPFPPNGTTYYIYQQGTMETSNGKVVYLLPTTAATATATAAGAMSVYIQANISSVSSIPGDAVHAVQDAFRTAQLMVPPPPPPQQQQQQQPVTYMTLPPPHPVHPSAPALDPATKLTLLRSPEVCRHYLNGRCNRRKCRFLHPDQHHPVEAARMPYITPEVATLAGSRTSQPTMSITPVASSLSSSANSFTITSTSVNRSGQHA